MVAFRPSRKQGRSVEADKGFLKGDSMAVDGVNEGTIALSLI
jgi:hypothetical protein